jgi:hypothetical protein
MALSNSTITTAINSYADWLLAARQSKAEQLHVIHYVFSSDGSAASFDNISYATTRISTEEQHKPE